MPRGGPAAEPMLGQHRPVNPVRVCRDRLYTHGAACITAFMPSEGPAGAAPALFVNTEPYIRLRAMRHLSKGRVVLFGAGTGNPYFSTDTAAVLRAAEIEADAILLAKNIDGVYSADPRVDHDAVKYDAITYDEVLAQHLAVMDTTATSLSMDNSIPVIVFELKDPENIVRAVLGEKIGTVVTK